MSQIDRSIELPYNEVQMPKFISPNIVKLDNGLEVFTTTGGGQELCRVELVFKAGTKAQHKALQASMCNAMLFEGTHLQMGAEIHETLDFYGAYTQLDINADRATVALYTLNKYFHNVFPVFIDAIKNANFPEETFKVLLEQKRQTFSINSEKVEYLARKEFFKILYKDHPYAASATLSDYDALSRKDLVDFHAMFYKSADFKIYIAGELPEKALELLDTSLKDWNLRTIDTVGEINNAIVPAKIHIKKEAALQSAIRIGRQCFSTKHQDFHELKFLSVILGGYFGSRLMSNIREDKGLTYGIGAMCVAQEESGYFGISTEVKGDSAKIALTEIYKEIKRLREELISNDELALVKNYIMGQVLKSADGPFAQASLLKNMHIQSADFSYYYSYEKFLNSLNAISLRELANTYLKEEELCEVVVGDISSLS